ncbi:MAG: hypothetical protein OER95_13910, partial [Acidimicrobiia bacterium]|nr:hypothetical protein [Acidimicrobiia bacterium]
MLLERNGEVVGQLPDVLVQLVALGELLTARAQPVAVARTVGEASHDDGRSYRKWRPPVADSVEAQPELVRVAVGEVGEQLNRRVVGSVLEIVAVRAEIPRRVTGAGSAEEDLVPGRVEGVSQHQPAPLTGGHVDASRQVGERVAVVRAESIPSGKSLRRKGVVEGIHVGLERL